MVPAPPFLRQPWVRAEDGGAGGGGDWQVKGAGRGSLLSTIPCSVCGCAKNLSYYKWCKHCHSPLSHVQPSQPRAPAGVWAHGHGGGSPPAGPGGGEKGAKGKGKGKGGKGKGRSLASLDGGASGDGGGRPALPPGPVPELSVAEAKIMADLSRKACDVDRALYYDQLAKSLAGPKVQEVPIHQRSQNLAAEVKRRERKLQHEFDKLAKWRADLEAQKALVLECKSELDKSDAEYQACVQELASAALKPTGPKQVDIKEFIDGKVDFDSFFNLDSLFDVQREVEDFELTADDERELELRKKTLSTSVQELASKLFKGALEASEAAKKEHESHKKRLTKKRRTDEGVAAPEAGQAAGSGDGAPGAADEQVAAAAAAVPFPDDPPEDIRLRVQRELCGKPPSAAAAAEGGH